MSEESGIDFALAAYREEGVWQLAELATDLVSDLDSVAEALRRYPGDNGTLGLLWSNDDELGYFLLVRAAGSAVRVLLSDAYAAEESELAETVLDFLDIDLDELDEVDEDEIEPVGDLDILGDWGFSAIDMGILLDEADLYPDEQLSQIAEKLGFGTLFDEAAGINNV